jgi:hypothetical protein
VAVDVVLDGPRLRLWPRALRAASAALGGVVLFLAALAATPALLVATVAKMDRAELRTGVPGIPALPAVVVDHRPLIFFSSLAVMVSGYLVGLPLLRGRREGVLFLRHFGDAEVTRVVTMATTVIGGRWRFITLDDSSISPVGVTPRARRIARSMSRFSELAPDWWEATFRISFNVLRGGCLTAIVLGFFLVLHDRYGSEDLLSITLEVALIATVVATLGAAFVCMGALVTSLLPIVAIGLFGAITSLVDVVFQVDEEKVATIDREEDIERVVTNLRSKVRRVFCPRLAVITVETRLWKQAVLSFAAHTSTALIDISQPTENLLWEIEQLALIPNIRCIFIGQKDRLLDVRASSPSMSPETALSHFLDGARVLGYDLDARGVGRFTRALRATLETGGDSQVN